MNIIIKTGFEKVTYDIDFQPQTIKKGKQLAEAEHVYDTQEIRSKDGLTIIKSDVI